MADSAAAGAPRVEPMGDGALLVTLGSDVRADLNAMVHRVVGALCARRRQLPGLGRPVPGYASVLVPFDPAACAEEVVRAAIGESLGDAERVGVEGAPGPLVEIPVRYGGRDGPDLADVAARLGRSEDEVVRLHAATEYRVFVLGFVPGFPYLGTLPETLALPRRATPRLRVPAGSVAIAGRQTGIYPASTPGGWHLLGRTDAVLWDPRREPPALLQPGARVRFVAS